MKERQLQQLPLEWEEWDTNPLSPLLSIQSASVSRVRFF